MSGKVLARGENEHAIVEITDTSIGVSYKSPVNHTKAYELEISVVEGWIDEMDISDEEKARRKFHYDNED